MAALATLLAAGCKQAPAPASAGPAPAASAQAAPAPGSTPAARDGGPALPPTIDGKSLHHTRLQEFAPDRILDFEGGKIAASTAQIGEVAVSEVERTYTSGAQTMKLRIVDTSLNRGARAPKPGPAFEDDQRIGRPVGTAGASGFVEYEKGSHRAVANLIVADRVLVTLAMEDAKGPEDIQRLAVALDLRKLDAMVLEHALLAPSPEPAGAR